MILQLIERGLTAGLQQRPIQRLPCLERKVVFERCPMLLRQRLESTERDALDPNGLALGNRDGNADGCLRVVQLRIERRHSCVRIAAVLVERNDAFEIRLELVAAEIVLRAPGNLRAGRGGQDRLQLTGCDRLGSLECETRDLDAALFLTRRGRKSNDAQEEQTEQRAAAHCVVAYSQAMPFRSGSTRFYKVLRGSARFCEVRGRYKKEASSRPPRDNCWPTLAVQFIRE